MDEEENYDNVWLEYANDDSDLDRILEDHLQDFDHAVAEWQHRHRDEPLDIDEDVPELPVAPCPPNQIGGQL